MCIFSLNLCQLNIGFGLGFSAVALPQIKEASSIEMSTWIEGAFGKEKKLFYLALESRKIDLQSIFVYSRFFIHGANLW